jgi:hypothetical protein
MTEEELIKDIAECFANCEGSVPIKLRHYEWANVVLNLIKEAGWKSPEEIPNATICPKCNEMHWIK